MEILNLTSANINITIADGFKDGVNNKDVIGKTGSYINLTYPSEMYINIQSLSN